MNQVTIGNQVEILMLIEDLELAGIHVVSANTDGLVCLFDKSLLDIYYKVCSDWEKQVGNDIHGKLEYQQYKSLIQTSVNDYIAVTVEGKVKQKGDFVIDFELHKNKSARIIPLTLNAYFINNTLPKEFIEKHENIFDFCLGFKGKGETKIIHLDKKTNTEVELQKINRFYISKDGKNLLKRLKPLEGKKVTGQIDIFGGINDGTREHEVEAGWLSTIYNKHSKQEIKKYNINYQYYIDKVNKIINQIQ